MKRVKISITLAVLTICLVSLSFWEVKAQSVNLQNEKKCSSEEEGLKMCIESLLITAKANEKVKILVSLSNSSETKSLVGSLSMYEYKIVSESGESLESIYDKKLEMFGHYLTKEFKDDWKHELRGGSSRRTFIKPQEIQKEEVNISKVYDFSIPGKYSVTIKRKLPGKNGNASFDLIIEKIKIEIEEETN